MHKTTYFWILPIITVFLLSGCEAICKDESKQLELVQAQAAAANARAIADAAAAKDAVLAANKALAARYFKEIVSEGKFEVADELVAPEFVYNDNTAETGPQAVKNLAGMFRTAFPDLKVEVLYQVAEGDLVTTHLMGTGTHQGDFLGLKPTGKTWRASGIHVLKIANGKFVRDWHIVDIAAIMAQLQPPLPAKKK